MSEAIQQSPTFSRINVGMFCLALVAGPGFVWLQSVGDLSIYIKYETPPGQVPYIFSKLAGMYAVFLLWLQVVFALIQKSPIGEKIAFWNLSLHRTLGYLSAGLLVLHASLYVAAASLRTNHLAFNVLLPDFSQGFYAFAVSLGVLAFYGMAVVIIAGHVRQRGIEKAKWLHRISILVLVSTLAHCLLIGTETRYVLMMTIYVFMICTLLAALVYRSWSRSSNESRLVDLVPTQYQAK